ncbi:MAG: HDOD domain-containing protein [Pirellulaceae bacterium]
MITLLQLSQNPDNGPLQYAAPIEADPGLLGQVLKFVNSSYFGFFSRNWQRSSGTDIAEAVKSQTLHP